MVGVRPQLDERYSDRTIERVWVAQKPLHVFEQIGQWAQAKLIRHSCVVAKDDQGQHWIIERVKEVKPGHKSDASECR